MLDFVERGGDPCQKQPCFVEGATAHGFLLKADSAALNKLVDRQINQPCGAQAFEAHTGWVVLLVAQLGQARNSSSGGYISDIDASFWVPLRSRGVLPGAAAHSFLLPYTFVSTGHGIAIGREVFGFNKMLSQFGDLQLPTNGDVQDISVKTVAVRQLALSAEAGFEEVVRITPTDGVNIETDAPPIDPSPIDPS